MVTPGNQHLAGVAAAGGDGLPLLPRHQVHQLVDHEGGREGEEAAGGDPDQIPAYRAPAAHSVNTRDANDPSVLTITEKVPLGLKAPG